MDGNGSLGVSGPGSSERFDVRSCPAVSDGTRTESVGMMRREPFDGWDAACSNVLISTNEAGSRGAEWWAEPDLKSWCRRFNPVPAHHSFNDLAAPSSALSPNCRRDCH
jgi:hypothetical protein